MSTEVQAARGAGATRERYLAALVEVQQRLLANVQGADPYAGVLAPLGAVAGASSCYVVETRRGPDGKLLGTLRAEWCAPGVQAHLGTPQMIDFPFEAAYGSALIAELAAGGAVQGGRSDFAPEAARRLEGQDIDALLLLPLRVGGALVGLVGFDACGTPRAWTPQEVDLLAGAAGALSLALSQRQAAQARQRTEAALAAREASFHLLIEGFPDAVLEHVGGTVRYANAAAAQLLSLEGGAQALVGTHLLDLLRPEDRADAQGPLLVDPGPRAVELPLLARDGRQRATELTTFALPALDEQANPTRVTVARDLTERKALQVRLMLNDRLASVGTLAAGVAHEINNPLAYLMANLDWVLGGLKPERVPTPATLTGWRDALEEAREGSERVRNIVRQLRTFSRPDDETKGPLDLNAVLDRVLEMAASQVRPRARVERLFADLPRVMANEGQLFQVFLNLVLNAAQAMGEDAPQAHRLTLVTRPDGQGNAVVEVHDTGVGIRPEHLERIFDPFFTTKPVGVGTGLGLSICHGIVRALGGDIQVESTPGVGTCFRVVLPALEAPHVPQASPTAPARAEPPRLRLLVVDDEPPVAAALGRLLESHHVELAHSGAQALELLQHNEWDAVLCDLMMPGVNGMEVYDRVCALAPALADRFVLVTGGAFTPRASDFLSRFPGPRLEKPFSAQALRDCLATLGLRA